MTSDLERGSMAALNAVVKFIDSTKELRGQLLETPFASLGGALADLEKGAVHPVIEPRIVGGRPPDSTNRASLRGLAAAVMSILVQFGLSRREAAKKVAEVLCHGGFKLDGRRQMTWQTVDQWRSQMAAEDEEDPAVAAFRLMLSRTSREAPIFPGERFEGATLKKLVDIFLEELAQNVALLRGVAF
jgi:hypothetical protein